MGGGHSPYITKCCFMCTICSDFNRLYLCFASAPCRNLKLKPESATEIDDKTSYQITRKVTRKSRTQIVTSTLALNETQT